MPCLIVLSHLRWDDVCRRPQPLMSCLSRAFPVLFVEEPVQDAGPARLVPLAGGPQVEVLVPHMPLAAGGLDDDEQRELLRLLLEAHLGEHGIADGIAWLSTPMALPLVDALHPRLVVYDCMDDMAGRQRAPAEWAQREAALLRRASLVFAGGPALYESRRGRHANLHCLPSAVDVAEFAPSQLGGTLASREQALQADLWQARLPRPRLGFYGAIDERLDTALLAAVADARPEWQLVMAGPVVGLEPAALPARPNLHWLGAPPAALRPHLVAGWDVCLLPYALNEATRCLSPTQTLEYMAGEKPVVSTPVADVVALHGDVVRIARDPARFVEACALALDETGRQRAERLNAMMSAVFRASWQSTARCVQALIEEALQVQLAPPAPAWAALADAD